MLEFFRKYQKFFFVFTTVIIVASFAFFGTFSTFIDENEIEDRILGQAIDGSPLKLSEVQLLSRFLATDREDIFTKANAAPNFCNDGVIRYDLLQTELANLLAAAYFEPLKEGMGQRLEKAKRYRFYTHPGDPSLSAKNLWEKFMPSLMQEFEALQSEESASPRTFAHLSKLYLQQALCPPEFLRRLLMRQQQQSPWLKPDPRLHYDDFSLFGFHSLSDWFGSDFIDLSAEFILNAARAAEQKGYRVSLEEAKADLLRNFTVSKQKLKEKVSLSFKEHFRVLGIDEKSAAEAWRSVLLFRRYFHGVGEATFVDRMPYREFAGYALEKAVVQLYQWPPSLRLKNFQDLIEFQVYLKAISNEKDPLALPSSFLSLEEIEKREPELIQSSYQAKISELSKEEIGLKASVKELWDWQLEEKNWDMLKEKFSFLSKTASSREERFQELEKLNQQNRMQLDHYTRLQWVDMHPEWIDESLIANRNQELTISISKNWTSLAHIHNTTALADLLRKASSGDEDAKQSLLQYCDDTKTFYRIESVEKISDPHIITFEEAKASNVIAKVCDRRLEAEYPKIRTKAPSKFKQEGKWKPFVSVKEEVAKIYFADLLNAIGEGQTLSYYATHRLETLAKEAFASFQKNPDDPRWLKGSGDPIADQFKFEKKECEIQRITQEEWMKEKAFVMVPKQWSPIHVPEDGDISFFYFEEKKVHSEPILEQLAFGKEMIAADAQRYLAERFLELTKKQNAICIPIQMDKE